MTLKTNYQSHKDVMFDISRLNDLFLKKFKRAPKAELVYSNEGPLKKPRHSLAIWATEQDSEEVKFFQDNLISVRNNN
jgi:hypothetical protein